MKKNSLLSRRQFNVLSAGFGVVALKPICLKAVESKLPSLSFVIVTDTHLGYKEETKAAQLWSKTAAEISKSDASFVLHLGDIVDGGREAQYPVYVETRKTIGKPVYEIPGNHDPEELFQHYIRKEVDTVVDHEWMRFLLVNNSHRDSHTGYLTNDQIEWINKQCQDAAKRKMFVTLAMHVPAHTNKNPDRGWYVLPKDGQTKLYEVLKQHQDRVVALFHGHFHNGLRGWNDQLQLHEICFPSNLYNLDRSLEAKQAPGYNLSEFRAGYTVVKISDGTMRLRYQPIGQAEGVSKECPLKTLG